LLEGIQHKLLIKLLGFNYTVEYKQGRTNKVADALSRATHSNSVMAISSVVPQWMAQVIKSYEQDIKCLDLITKLSIDPHAILNFSLSQGLLIYNGKLVIGDNGELKQHLLQSLHSSALGGHSGERATYQRIKLHFYWPKLKQHVTEFVKTCAVCQKNKSENVPYPGLLQPLPVPDMAWTHISMDFIEGLPKSENKDVILVVVDRLSKYAHFLSLAHPYTAEQASWPSQGHSY
jgi:hypothetical protein